MSSHRRPTGGLIDRTRAVRFEFDGQSYAGHPGDTLASALLASGQWLMARSFKYHRPRSVLTAGSAEPNALVTTGIGSHTETNVRATMLEIYDGLVANPQNCWPSLQRDIGALNGLFGPVLAAGFYYKTFMWPASFWEKIYEPLIRRAAGLGKASALPDPDTYEKRWAHCDLLVVGAGPSGISAALTAARAGASVMLIDEQHHFGGELAGQSAIWSDNEAPATDASGASEWLDPRLAELRSLPNARVLLRTTVFGCYDSGVYAALERVGKHRVNPQTERKPPAESLWRIVAKRCVMATGAQERPLVFNGNDRPGILLAGALQTYAERYAVVPGQSVAILTNNDAGYRSAAGLVAAGIPLKAVIDQRSGGSTLPLAQQLGSQTRVITNAQVVSTRGRHRLCQVTIRTPGGTEQLALDTLGVSGGYSPVIHLACQRGAKPQWNETQQWFGAPDDRDGLFACGAAAGFSRLSDCIEHGEQVALHCLTSLGKRPEKSVAPPGHARNSSESKAHPSWHIGGSGTKAFVDFQNDVVATDLVLAVREGYGHVEMAKRYTTTGMATDQGKTGNINAIGLLADARGVSCGDIGTTTFRPFYTPVSFGALAGSHIGEDYQPRRRSALHEWAESLDASFVDSGHWDRAAWFPRAGETQWRESVDREVNTVRAAVGLTDVSTLGKIELFGPDCAEFLNRIYCNKFAKLPIGKARYGLMLREDGFILDDGTTSRLAEHHYLMTTTTGAAAQVLTHLEWCHQVLWPELDLRFAAVSDQWAQMAIAGPKSREVLQLIVKDDLSDDEIPFLAARSITLVSGVAARLFRISFSGELGYELAVPANLGVSTAQMLMKLGQPAGITAYGTEAMSVLRIEKGFVTHAEIDGRVTPGDLGMARLAATDKHYIGEKLLRRNGLQSPARGQLVGLQPLDQKSALRAGAHLMGEKAQDPQRSPSTSEGHITSACYSPTMGSPIALALLSNGTDRIGQTILVRDELRNTAVTARVCPPNFLESRASQATQQKSLPAASTTESASEESASEPIKAHHVLSNAIVNQFNEVSTGIELSFDHDRRIILQLNAQLTALPTAPPRESETLRRQIAPDRCLLLDQDLVDGVCIDQTDARCVFVLRGPFVREVLSRGTSINLSADAMPTYQSQATLLGRISAVLTRLDDHGFEVIVNRSYAQALVRQLGIWAKACEATKCQ